MDTYTRVRVARTTQTTGALYSLYLGTVLVFSGLWPPKFSIALQLYSKQLYGGPWCSPIPCWLCYNKHLHVLEPPIY